MTRNFFSEDLFTDYEVSTVTLFIPIKGQEGSYIRLPLTVPSTYLPILQEVLNDNCLDYMVYNTNKPPKLW